MTADLFLRRLYRGESYTSEAMMCGAEPNPKSEFYEIVLPDALLHKYPDVWLKSLPGWITTHVLAKADYKLVIRQKHTTRRGTLPKICARFTPNVDRISGIRLVIRGQEKIYSTERFFELLLTKINEFDLRFDYSLKMYGLDKMSEDVILDHYNFESLLARHNERKLEAIRKKQPHSSDETIDVEEAITKLA